MIDELPEPWGSAVSSKGVHSYADLAGKIGGSKSKAHRLVNGKGVSEATLQAAADALFGGDIDEVQKLRGSSIRRHGPWSPPDEAHLLTPKQREALEALIVAMVPEEVSKVVPIKRATHQAPATKAARKPPRKPSNAPDE